MSSSKQLDLIDSEPPFTNRGVTVSIDWISVTFFTKGPHPVIHLLNTLMGYEIEDEMEWSDYFYHPGYGARGDTCACRCVVFCSTRGNESPDSGASSSCC